MEAFTETTNNGKGEFRSFTYRKGTHFSQGLSASEYTVSSLDNFLPNISENGKSLLKGFYDGSYSFDYGSMQSESVCNSSAKHHKHFVRKQNKCLSTSFSHGSSDNCGTRRYLGISFDPLYEKSTPLKPIRVLIKSSMHSASSDIKDVLSKISKGLKLKKKPKYAFLPDGKPVTNLAEIPKDCENIVVYHQNRQKVRSSTITRYIISKDPPSQRSSDKKYSKWVLRDIWKPNRSLHTLPSKYSAEENATLNTSYTKNNSSTLMLRRLNAGADSSHSKDKKIDSVRGYQCHIKKFSVLSNSGSKLKGKLIENKIRLRGLLRKSPRKTATKNVSHISLKELAELESQTGLSRSKILDLHSKFNDPGVTFEEFMEDAAKENEHDKEEVKQVFETMDKSENGYLNWQEYVAAIGILCSNIESRQFQLFFHVLSKKGYESLSYKDLLTLSEKAVRKLEFSQERISKLARDFVNLVYKVVGIRKAEAIPLASLKNAITRSPEETARALKLLCMPHNISL